MASSIGTRGLCSLGNVTIALNNAINDKGRYGGVSNLCEADAYFTISLALKEEEEISLPCGCVRGAVGSN